MGENRMSYGNRSGGRGGYGSSRGGGYGSGSSGGGRSSSSSGGPDSKCQAQSRWSCVDCCQTTYPNGAATAVSAIQQCTCGAGNPCDTVCASEYCANGTVATEGDACEACVYDTIDPTGTTCDELLLISCSNSAGCTAFLQCAKGCPAQ